MYIYIKHEVKKYKIQYTNRVKLYTKMDIYIILYTKRILETSLISVNFLWKSKMHDKTFY